MVHFKAAKTGASYRAISHMLASGDNIPRDGNDEKPFFALYQTDRKHCLDHPEYKDKVRLKSQLWDEKLSCHDVGAFTTVDLELVEVLGSYEYNESMNCHISYRFGRDIANSTLNDSYGTIPNPHPNHGPRRRDQNAA